MLNNHNHKLFIAAKKRRAMYYKLHLRGLSCADIARKYGVSRQRMHMLITRAIEDATCK